MVLVQENGQGGREMISKRKMYQSVQLLLVFSMLIAFVFPLQAKGAAEFSLEEEEQIEELAAQLEYLMEEAYILEDGIGTFDFEKVEAEFGKETRTELERMTVGVETGPSSGPVIIADNPGWKACMIAAIKDHFGVAFVTAALEGGLWAYLEKKAYKEAAKLLVKFAVGTNAVALAGTLIYYGGKCTYLHG